MVRQDSGSAGYNEDFVFGSPQLDDDGDTDHDKRMFFDKSKGAFRAGRVHHEDWNENKVGDYSVAFGSNTVASGKYAHAEGANAEATGEASHAEGYTVASGKYAHAEGANAEATGEASHAEGYTVASGKYAHAEGANAAAFGEASHAEGYVSEAIGKASHSEGYFSVASLYGQHAHNSGKISSDPSFTLQQYSRVVACRRTDTATQRELKLGNTSMGVDAGDSVVLPSSTTWVFLITLNARQTGGSAGTVGDSAMWKMEGMIKRDGSNNTTLVGTVNKSRLAKDAAFGGSVVVEADDNNEALAVKVTGETDKDIRWVAAIHLTEIGDYSGLAMA